MNKISDYIRSKKTDKKFPAFRSGDTIRVGVSIKEGGKERVQDFEGLVVRIKKGPQASFTVRKVAFGVGVERTFPFDCPSVQRIELLKEGKVRRSRLYYMRDRTGKGTRIEEKGKGLNNNEDGQDVEAAENEEVEVTEKKEATSHAQAVSS
ncbi:MAG: 50S ribosomal protein L19 [Deltaproteobacteria bacterium]|nr:50S ribosomal protein L19 [Deltaproteobacteria bacterium]